MLFNYLRASNIIPCTYDEANESQLIFFEFEVGTSLHFITYNARRRIDLTVQMIDIGTAASTFGRSDILEDIAKMVHGREERRKRGRKTRGPFLLEGKRWLQLSRYLSVSARSVFCVDGIPDRRWVTAGSPPWETRYIGCGSSSVLASPLSVRHTSTLLRYSSCRRHRRGIIIIIKADFGVFSGLVNHHENLFAIFDDTRVST